MLPSTCLTVPRIDVSMETLLGFQKKPGESDSRMPLIALFSHGSILMEFAFNVFVHSNMESQCPSQSNKKKYSI